MNSIKPGRLTEVRLASQRGSHLSLLGVYDRLAGTTPNTHMMSCLGESTPVTTSMRTPLNAKNPSGDYSLAHWRFFMIHFINIDQKTMCGIKLECPVKNIDPYDSKTIVDKNGIIVTGFGLENKFNDYPKPTCAECNRMLQQSLYHCSVHGFLDGIDVTFYEKCVYCGNSV